MNLSSRIRNRGGNRIADDSGTGFRANAGDMGFNLDFADRSGFGAEQNPSANQSQDMMTSSPKGNPHSSSGFRRALERTQRSSSSISKGIVNRSNFGGKDFKKPNYFGQGARRRGMHIGSGAPAITPTMDAGSDVGGE